jgi:hypothetical protein
MVLGAVILRLAVGVLTPVGGTVVALPIAASDAVQDSAVDGCQFFLDAAHGLITSLGNNAFTV